jgi:TRAP-type C4-dicarboxylate transport system permease large subunit
VTTEHFTLQGARAAAITESTSRATIFIGSVSAGLVALGLIATATRIGTAFYAFGLILLSTLSFMGFVTLDRVLQSGIEELHYAERIARLRAYYFDFAPELTRYLASVPPSRRLAILGLLATIAAGHSAVAGFVTGGVVGAAVLVALMWYQLSAWVQAHQQRLFENEQEGPDAG